MALAARKKVFVVSDSLGVGVGAGSTGTGNVGGSRPNSFPLKAVAYLVAQGVPARADTVVSDNLMTVAADRPLYRTDMTFTVADMTAGSVSPTAGGTQFRMQSSPGPPVVGFTPGAAFDTIELWQPQLSGGGNLLLSVDGGAATSYSGANATTIVTLRTQTVTKATHTLSFTSNGVNGAYFPIINCYDSTTPSVQMFNGSARGWTSGNWAASSNAQLNNPLNSIANVTPDIVVINLGTNDWRQAGVSIATFKTNIQTIINKAFSVGARVILMVPSPISGYSTTTDAWSAAAVLQAHLDLLAANPTITLIDTPRVIYAAYPATTDPGSTVGTRVNTYSSLLAAGLYPNADGLHPGAGIYAAIGDALGAAIYSILFPVIGTANITFAAMTTAGSGKLAIAGQANNTFAPMTLSGTGRLVVRASANVTFAPMTMSGSGRLPIQAGATINFAPMTTTGAGKLPIAGQSSATFAPMTMNGVGHLDVHGVGAATFQPLTVSGTGEVSTQYIIGTADITFAPMTLAGLGEFVVSGSLDATFQPMTVDAAGKLSITGTADITFGEMTTEGVGQTHVHMPITSPVRFIRALYEDRTLIAPKG